MRRSMLQFGSVILLAGLLVFACNDSSTNSNDDDTSDMPFGTQRDIAMADSMWNAYSDYADNWDQYPGLEGWQDGNSPHGAYLKYYINDIAKGDLENFPYGSVIIKENYPAEDESQPGPITFMTRIEGYDSDNYDWFYAKYLPDGHSMKMTPA
ncbi:MAG: hypothetical protein MAGBODY4_01530 [Candidatus Marinimicrobia bacterium]|nr:hypothetical protein [Candidatus Neomarinimicrobiota bacterium]